MKIINDMFMKNGKWDPKALGWSLLAWLLLILTYVVATMISVIHGKDHHFDMQSFGIGAGSLLAGGGLGVLWHGRSSGSGDIMNNSANSQSDSGNAAGLNGG